MKIIRPGGGKLGLQSRSNLTIAPALLDIPRALLEGDMSLATSC